MYKKLGPLFGAIFLLSSTQLFATSYILPPPEQSLIGNIKYTSAGWNDTAANLAHHYDIGFNAIAKANPHLQLAQNKVPSGAPMTIPSQHLLPDLPRKGIIINLPEMRMYYFLPGSNKVLTYPIGIGKNGKTIPITETFITEKKTNPTWRPPDDIREFNLEQGIILPKVMQPGPDNPLGHFAIYMKLPTYLIHSTIFPESVGKRASFGCIRMYESDIESFFATIESGIPVAIINAPVKINWQAKHLMMEAHVPLEEHSTMYESSLPGIIHNVVTLANNKPTLIDWQSIAFIEKERDGLPHDIGFVIH